jgi:hypothetical protein
VARALVTAAHVHATHTIVVVSYQLGSSFHASGSKIVTPLLKVERGKWAGFCNYASKNRYPSSRQFRLSFVLILSLNIFALLFFILTFYMTFVFDFDIHFTLATNPP